jgi:hypothetical protein
MQGQPPILPYRSPDPLTYHQRQRRLAKLYGFRRLDEWRQEGLKLVALVSLGLLAVYALWLLYSVALPSENSGPEERSYHPNVPTKSDEKSDARR